MTHVSVIKAVLLLQMNFELVVFHHLHKIRGRTAGYRWLSCLDTKVEKKGAEEE